MAAVAPAAPEGLSCNIAPGDYNDLTNWEPPAVTAAQDPAPKKMESICCYLRKTRCPGGAKTNRNVSVSQRSAKANYENRYKK